MSSPEKSFSRQWQMIQRLSESTQGLTVRQLAEAVSCSQRTVKRNLALFREQGIPLEETVGSQGLKTYRIKFEGVSFTYDEVAAVYISRRFLEPMMGTQFWEATQNALRKMRSCLGTQAIRHLDRSVGLIEHTPFGRSDYQQLAPVIDDLHFAIEEKRQITILYQSLQETQPSTTQVDPYGLAFHDGSLYLIGFSHKRQAIRHWKIDRMKSVTVLNSTFRKPQDFNFEQWIEELFGIFKCDPAQPLQTVRIRFKKEVAKQVREKHWHQSERFTPEKGGSLLLELQLENVRVLKPWVLGYGRHAEVLEPAELRDYVRNEIRALTQTYESSNE